MSPQIANPERSLVEVVGSIAQALVDDPGAVHVWVSSDAGVGTVNLSVADEDVGKVIGRNGRMATAINRIVWAICERQGSRYKLLIVKPTPPSEAP